MEILIDDHAKERATERGATEEEYMIYLGTGN